jgi:hypothetical protein
MRCSVHKSAAGKRVFWILVVGLIAAAVISTSTGSSRRKPHSVSPPPQPASMRDMSARRLQTYAADSAVLGGANAGQREFAALRQAEKADPPTVPVSVIEPAAVTASSPAPDANAGKHRPAIKFRVRSEAPHASKEKALADALAVARFQLAEKLITLDPPVRALPTVEQVRAEYIRPESVVEVQPKPEDKAEWKARGLDENRVWVDVDVEVSDDQVRQLRSVGRLEKTAVVSAVAFVLVLGLFGFLRLDAWTKGYLTTVIGVGVVAAVVAAMALIVTA